MTFENEISPNEEINSNKRSHTNTLIPWPHYINYKGEIVRKIDEVFIFWLVLLPIFAYWFLFGDGYTTKAKVGWGLYAIFIWPTLIGLLLSGIFFSSILTFLLSR